MQLTIPCSWLECEYYLELSSLHIITISMTDVYSIYTAQARRAA